MPDYEELLQKLLPSLEKEVPAVAESRAVTPAVKTPEVVGEGSSKAVPTEPEVKDADVSTQQAPQGPNQAALEDKSDPWEARKAKLKSLALPVAAAAAGTAAGLTSDGGSSGNNPAKADEPSPSPKTPAKATPAPSDDDEDEDEGDDESPASPKVSAKSAPTAASYLSKATPVAVPQLPANDPNVYSSARLAQLQEQSNRMQALNNLARGMTAAVATAGQQRTNNFDPMFEAQGKQFAAMPDQYVRRAAMQKMDPNSPASIASRNLAAYIDPDMKVTPDMSAADLEKILPQMANIETNEEATQARLQTAKMHNDSMMMWKQQRADAAQAAVDAKQDKQDSDRMNTWANKLSLPTSRSTLGQAKAQLFSVDRVQALLNGHPLNDINPQEAAEVYRGLDRVISGGSPTVQGSKSLDPDTAMAGIAHLMQQFTNQSQSANAQNFLARTNHNLENEKEAARKTVLDISNQFLAGGKDLYDRKPDQVRDFLSRSGLPTDMFDPAAAVTTKVNTGDDTGSSNRSYVSPAIRQAAQAQAAAVVGRDTKAQADSQAAPAASGQSLPDAAAAEIARRKAARAQAGGQ